MKIRLWVIWVSFLYCAILFISNWFWHDRTFVFDRDFILILALMLIWVIASLLVLLLMPNKDIIKKNSMDPSYIELFFKNRQDILLFCIHIFTIIPLLIYMAFGKAIVEPIKLVAFIVIASLGSTWYIWGTLRSLRRKWHKDNLK